MTPDKPACACLEYWDSHHPECPTGLGKPTQPEPVSGNAATPVGVRRYIGQMSYRGEIVSGLDSWVRAADHQAALTAAQRDRDAQAELAGALANELNAEREKVAAAQQRIAELREQVSAAKELAEMAADVHERMSELNIDFAPGDQIALQLLHHATAKFAALANPPQDRKEQS